MEKGKLCVCGSYCLKEGDKIEVFVKEENGNLKILFNYFLTGWCEEVKSRLIGLLKDYYGVIFFETPDVGNFVGKTEKGLVLFYNLPLGDQKQLTLALS